MIYYFLNSEILSDYHNLEFVYNYYGSNSFFSKNKINEKDILIVLVELKRYGKQIKQSVVSNFTEFYGFEFTKKVLRTEFKFKNPVIFTSFLPFEYFIYKDSKNKIINPNNEILLTTGHDFLRFPFTLKELEKKIQYIKPLTDFQLRDVIYNYCNLNGMVDEVTHKYIGQARVSLEKNEEKLKEIKENGVNELNLLLGSNKINQENYNIDMDNYLTLFRKMGEEAKQYIPHDKNEFLLKVEKSLNEKPWKILILDDYPEELNNLNNLLKMRGIETIIRKNYAEAIEEIREDIFNYITVVISDYRLLEEKNGYLRQQDKQGYDFLFNVSKMDRINRLVAFSGLSRSFLLDTFRTFDINLLVYSKNDILNENSLKVFVDTLELIGDEEYSKVLNKPSSKSWVDYSEHYKDFRSSKNKSEIEKEISEKALMYINRVEKVLLSKDDILRDNLDLISLKPATKIAAYNSEPFMNKMAARRIAIYLILKYGFEPVKIYSLFSSNTLNSDKIIRTRAEEYMKENIETNEAYEKARKDIVNSAKQMINKNLAITDLLPFGILIEESKWLKEKANFDIVNISSSWMDYIYGIQVLIQQLLDKNKAIELKLLNKFNDNFVSYKELNHIYFSNLADAKKIVDVIRKEFSDLKNRQDYYMLLEGILDLNSLDDIDSEFVKSEKNDFEEYIKLNLSDYIKK
jgi:hypothetical protein